MSGLLRSRAFWLINFANFADGIAYFGILTLLVPFLGGSLHFSDPAAGKVVSLFTGVVTLFMVFGGNISDALGVRRSIVGTMLLVSLGRALLAFSPDLPFPELGRQFAALLALLIMATCAGVNQPALYAGMKQYSPPGSTSMAYSLLYAIMNLGIVCFSFISPFLRTKEHFVGDINGLGLGIPGVFRALTLVSILASLLIAVLFTSSVEKQELQTVESPEPQPGEQQEPGGWRSLPVFDLRFAFFIFALLPVRTLFAHQWLTLPDYVLNCYPVEVNAKFEWVSGLNPAIVTLGTPLLSLLLARTHVLTVMLVGTALSAASTFLVASPPDVTRLLAYVAIFSVGEAVWSSRFYEYVADLAPPHRVGAYMGVAGLPWFLAKFTTGLYSGYFIQKYIKSVPPHPETLWLIYACFACVTPVALLLARRWLMQGEKRATV